MDAGGEIRLGSMLFTLVEPHRGHEVEYNRWYERDHFYAGCMVGPWLFAGRRWVATRELKDLRFPTDPPMFGDPRLGSYLAVYWVIDGKHDEHFSWALRQVRWLHENGRMFDERDHIHTLLYRFAWSAGDDDGVPPELALDHPFETMVATVVERADGVATADLEAWGTASRAGALTLAFDPIPLPPGAPVTQPGMDGIESRTMVLSFHDAAVEAVWPLHRGAAKDLEKDGLGRVSWTSPFVPTVPGTDRFTGELW